MGKNHPANYDTGYFKYDYAVHDRASPWRGIWPVAFRTAPLLIALYAGRK